MVGSLHKSFTNASPKIRPAHPVRHGMDGLATVGMIGRRQRDLVTRAPARAARPLPE